MLMSEIGGEWFVDTIERGYKSSYCGYSLPGSRRSCRASGVSRPRGQRFPISLPTMITTADGYERPLPLQTPEYFGYNGGMTDTAPKPRWFQCRLRTLLVLATFGAILCCGLGWWIQQARRDGRRCNAYDRLGQMRLALQNYEAEHGKLPPLTLRNKQGEPNFSWRGLILPYLESDFFKQIDLSQPWNSERNRKVVEAIPLREWTWFARDRDVKESPAATHIMAYLGPNSMWDGTTGLPKGKTEEHPKAILLISIPQSQIEPLQPGDITEEEVRTLIEDGQEVLFMMANTSGGYGIVGIEHGKLTFHTWNEVLDER